MSRLIVPTVVAVLIASSSVRGASAGASYASGNTMLSIDGVSCGEVFNVEGGDARTSVVSEKPLSGAPAKKHIAGVTFAPITLEVALPMPQPLERWVGDMFANRQTRRTLQLTDTNLNGQIVGTPLEATGVLLAEVRFPAFDAAQKQQARATLVFAPESTRVATVATSSAAASTTGRQAAALVSNYRLQIGSLATAHVVRIDSFAIKQATSESGVGAARDYAKEPAALEFPNIIVTITTADLADWKAWHEDFVVKGNCSDTSEKSGSFSLLDASLQNILFTVQFSHVGIVRLSPVAASNTDTSKQYQAEIYCESMAIGNPATASKAATSSSGEAASTSSTPAPATNPTPAGSNTGAPIRSVAGTPIANLPTAIPAVAGNIPVRTGTPVAESAPVTSPPVATTTAPPPAASTGVPTKPVTSSNDVGARDLADFPRLEGTVRTSYTQNRQRAFIQEVVTYSSSETEDALEESYEKTLTGAGWELDSRYENNNGTGGLHIINVNWAKASKTAAITLSALKEGGAEISIMRMTTLTPP